MEHDHRPEHDGEDAHRRDGHGHDHDHRHGREHGHDHGHDHGLGHSHGHDHRPGSRRRLLIALIVTGVVMVAEVVGGLVSNSLALVSDAGHMFTHFLALGLSWLAIVIAARPAPAERSFGYYRAEVLAAFTNGLFLVGVTVYILVESAIRLAHPQPVATMEMLVVAAVGLVANLVSALLLAGADRHDLNVRSAFLHMLGDLLSSVGVVGGAVLIGFTGWTWVDPALGAVIAVAIGIWSVKLLRDSGSILLESAPRHVDLAGLEADMRAAGPEVRGLHDLHVWEITAGMYAMTAHVAVAAGTPVERLEELRTRLSAAAAGRFRVGHAVFQFESETDSLCRHSSGPE